MDPVLRPEAPGLVVTVSIFYDCGYLWGNEGITYHRRRRQSRRSMVPDLYANPYGRWHDWRPYCKTFSHFHSTSNHLKDSLRKSGCGIEREKKKAGLQLMHDHREESYATEYLRYTR